ncbi:MAG: E3 binding domain-containing protein [Devosia sp.]
MASATAPTPRLAASPYARKLALARGIALDRVRGTGPNGRVVGKDIEQYVAEVAMTHQAASISAFATTIQLDAILRTLEGFATSGTPFELEDMVLRAVACALDDVPTASRIEGTPVALESKTAHLVFDNIRRGSLAPLRSRRLAAMAAGDNHSSVPAVISVRLLLGSTIRPVIMPLLSGRTMRLVLAVGSSAAEALLSFDAAHVDEDLAAEVLTRLKAYVEMPLLLLA